MVNNNTTFFKIIAIIVYRISYPVIAEFYFFITSIILQVLPIIMCSYYNYGSMFEITTALNNPNVCSIPYILYIPFLISYFFCVVLVSIKNVSRKLYKAIKIFIFMLLALFELIDTFLLVHFQTMINPSMILLVSSINNSLLSS